MGSVKHLEYFLLIVLCTFIKSSLCVVGSCWSKLDKKLFPNTHNAIISNPRVPAWNRLCQSDFRIKKLKPLVAVFGTKNASYTILSWSDLKKKRDAEAPFFKSVFNSNEVKRQLSAAKKLVVVTHGFYKTGKCEKGWVFDAAKRIQRQSSDTAIIVLCWDSFDPFNNPGSYKTFTDLHFQSRKSLARVYDQSTLACSGVLFFYYNYAASTAKMGEFVGQLVKSIKSDYPAINYFYGVGHSLGAQVMGNVHHFGGVTFDRITGLDPAGPCFEGAALDIKIKGIPDWGLSKNSAKYVDTINTDSAWLGSSTGKGHANFWLGNPTDPIIREMGGSAQPNCIFPSCLNHMRAKVYFLDSIDHPGFYKTAYEAHKGPLGRKMSVQNADSKFKTVAGFHHGDQTLNCFDKSCELYVPIFPSNTNVKWAANCNKDAYCSKCGNPTLMQCIFEKYCEIAGDPKDASLKLKECSKRTN